MDSQCLVPRTISDVVPGHLMRTESDVEQYYKAIPPFPPKNMKQIVFEEFRKSLVGTFPARKWISQYRWKDLLSDFLIGLTIGIVVVPQGLAYGTLAGLPPVFGLYCAMLPGVLYAIFGTSKELAVGPTALVSTLTGNVLYETLTPAEMKDPSIVVGTAMVVAFYTGLIFLVLWALQGGFVAQFISPSVLSSFTCAVAIGIAVGQLPAALGFKIPRGETIETAEKIIHAIAEGDTNYCALIITICVLIILSIGRNINQRLAKKKYQQIPWEIVVVIATILLTRHYRWNEKYNLPIIGKVPSGLPGFQAPPLSKHSTIFFSSLALAIIDYIESISTARRLADKHHYEVYANQELFALGWCCLIGSFFLCFPSAGSLSRSALVSSSRTDGTPAFSIFVAALVALVLTLLTETLFYLPKATLAAIILNALRSLLLQILDPYHSWRHHPGESVVWVVCALATIIGHTSAGILTGLFASMFLLIHSLAYPLVFELGRLPGSRLYRNIQRFPTAKRIPGVIIVHYGRTLNFVNRDRFKVSLERLRLQQADAQIKAIIIDAKGMEGIDSAAFEMLEKVRDQFLKDPAGPIEIHWAGAVPELVKILKRLEFQHFFISVSKAVSYNMMTPEEAAKESDDNEPVNIRTQAMHHTGTHLEFDRVPDPDEYFHQHIVSCTRKEDVDQTMVEVDANDATGSPNHSILNRTGLLGHTSPVDAFMALPEHSSSNYGTIHAQNGDQSQSSTPTKETTPTKSIRFRAGSVGPDTQAPPNSTSAAKKRKGQQQPDRQVQEEGVEFQRIPEESGEISQVRWRETEASFRDPASRPRD
eukprot:g61426.t1